MAGYPAYAGFADPGAAPYGVPAPVTGDEVRTIFITGFPYDVKERDLNNLLRFLPGYEASQMTWKNESAQGFALFASMPHAHSALEALNTLMFDETSVLRAEMARKNMYIQDGENPHAPKRPRPAPGGFAPGGYGPPGGRGPPRDNPPCNTLYVGNLSEHTHEADLRSLFEHQPGFVSLAMGRSLRGPTAFVEFVDVASAAACHAAQQQAAVHSGMTIQYAKNPSKKRERDPLTGAVVSPATAAAAAAAPAAPAGYEPPPYVPPSGDDPASAPPAGGA